MSDKTLFEPTLESQQKGVDSTQSGVDPNATGGYSPPDPNPTATNLSSSPNTSASKEFGIIAGKYVLGDILGEGGMGSVFQASQTEPVKRQVALKLIKVGIDSRSLLARFDAERQALALMDHPNIARIYDGGVTDRGQPFFVMELVQGVPLTDYCDQKRLSVQDRLQLFVQVCNAVQHAHQKGIIHRDLKPGNVLVTEVDGRPTPKVIDFGVAKAMDQRLTEMSLNDDDVIVGTPAYMSPEQADPTSMDIDTRTDVYALGVILYELLTGTQPIEAKQFNRGAILEMLRMVREVDPPRPSTKLSTAKGLPKIASNRNIDPAKLAKLLQGELDWVAMKAIEKDRSRRYDTANGLARDILRYLADEIVEARPPSAKYRFRKFLKRNKASAIASAAVATAVIIGFVGTTWGWIESRRQAEIARIEALTQLAIHTFLREDILAQASSETQSGSIFQPDPDLKVKTALDRAANTIHDRFGDQPMVAAALHRTIGQAYSDLGEYSAAQPMLERSLELYRQYSSPSHRETLLAMQSLGYLYQQQEKLDLAEALLTESLESYRQSAKETRDSLNAAINLANCYKSQAASSHDPKKREMAKQLYLKTLALQKKMLGDQDLDVSRTLYLLGILYRLESIATADPKLLDVAEATIQQALDSSQSLPDNHPMKLRFRYSIALLATDKREYGRALKIREEVLAGCLRTFGEVNPNTVRAMDSVALNYMTMNKTNEAESYFLRSLAARRKMYGDDHLVTERAIFSIGQFYFNAGNMEKAEPYYRERLERNRRLRGPDAIDTHLAGRDLAQICSGLGKSVDAEQLLKSAIDGLKKHFDDSNPIVVLTREYQADVLMNLGRTNEALTIYQDCVQRKRAQQNPDPFELASSIASLGQCQLKVQKFEEAENSFRESTELFKKYIPEAWPAFYYRLKIGVALAARQQFAAAEPILLDSFKGLKARRTSVPPDLYQDAIQAIIDLYTAMKKPKEVEKWQQEQGTTKSPISQEKK